MSLKKPNTTKPKKLETLCIRGGETPFLLEEEDD